jgi:hypothetical protein
MRGINKNGQRTVDVLVRLRDEYEHTLAEGPVLEGGADPELWQEAMDRLADFLNQGEEFEEFWKECVHGEDPPSPGEARQIKKNWMAWAKQGKSIASDLAESRRFAERMSTASGSD